MVKDSYIGIKALCFFIYFCTNRYSLGNIFCESYLWVAQAYLIFGGLLFFNL